MLELRIVTDDLMPKGHDWLKVAFPGGRVVYFLSESYTLEHTPEHPLRVLGLAPAMIA